MAQTKKEKSQAEEVKSLAPKKEDVDVKDLTPYKWNPDIFNKSKSYKDKNGNYKDVAAPWVKMIINGISIVAREGEKLTKKELAAFTKESKETKDRYFTKVSTKKED